MDTVRREAIGVRSAWAQPGRQPVALLGCYRADSLQIGTRANAYLITSHRLWSDWLDSGRVRKFAMVAEEQ